MCWRTRRATGIVSATLEGEAKHLKERLGLLGRNFPISTLRGAYVDNREWLDDPAAPAIVVGTVDMIGSRLLFEGYGVSRNMRPYQAGLLGVDALIVLDEAHLVPPFAHLLRSIERDTSLWPQAEADCGRLPRFAVLPLSATQRDSSLQGRPPFRLNEGDASDKAVAQRLGASKRLRLVSLREAEQDKQVAQVAWELATRSGKPARVVVFCDRRDRKDGGRGPSAQGVRDAVEEMAKGDRRAGRPKTDIHPPELLVGARRVWERQRVADCLRKLGFIGGDGPPDKPAFLIATAAGEVGVDIDADHMVSDLVSWERMVQRLGRVNRRGKGDAEVVVLWGEPSIRNADAPTESERRALIAFASKGVIESLPHANGAFDASPGALRRLAECARQDADFKARIDKATISEPLRPGLTRALVDAWSMTSLKEHTGRPEVAPWLRGWVEEVPQTTVIWRMHIPVRIDSRGRAAPASRAEIEDFFEATPPHDSEKLETETHRVLSWLADLLKDDKRGAVSGSTDDEDRDSAESAVNGGNAETPEANLAESAVLWAARPKRNDIAALVLSPGGAYSDGLTVRDLAQEGKDKKDLHEAIVGKVVVIDARLGGVKDGLLNPKSLNTAETADSFPARSEDTLRHWSEQARFCVRRARSLSDDEVEGWRFEHAFPLCRDDEGGVQEWLIVEHYKDAAQQEDARSISNPQELAVHRDLTRAR